MATALIQQATRSPLTPREHPSYTPTEQDTALEVLACAPTVRDLCDDALRWPRVPGGVFAGVDVDGDRWLCGGVVPCGQCQRCQTAHHEACSQPYMPGANKEAPGGLASHVALPRSGCLAPLQGPDLREEAIPGAVALVAAAGLAYQAAASAGMMPGDTVYVIGDVGPGALPLRALQALGLCAVWIGGDADAGAPEGVPLCDAAEVPEPASPRCHTLDLRAADGEDLDRPLALAGRSLTLTFARPTAPRGPAALDRLLAGAVTTRWVRHLHPHLALDLAALALTGDLDLAAHVEPCSQETFPAAWEALTTGEANRWPVLVNTL